MEITETDDGFAKIVDLRQAGKVIPSIRSTESAKLDALMARLDRIANALELSGMGAPVVVAAPAPPPPPPAPLPAPVPTEAVKSMTIVEAAKFVGCTRPNVEMAVTEGKLERFKGPDGLWCVTEAGVKKWRANVGKPPFQRHKMVKPKAGLGRHLQFVNNGFPSKVFGILYDARPGYAGSDELARLAGSSEAHVRAAIRLIRNAGFQVETIMGTGYRLVVGTDGEPVRIGGKASVIRPKCGKDYLVSRTKAAQILGISRFEYDSLLLMGKIPFKLYTAEKRALVKKSDLEAYKQSIAKKETKPRHVPGRDDNEA